MRLIGIRLDGKTTNANGQSAIDCGALWQTFLQDQIMERIQGRMDDIICAVYYDYDGDHTKPIADFIGCRVSADGPVLEGLSSIFIPTQSYQKFVARGKMPDCVTDTWKRIWDTDLDRAYTFDFEVYDQRGQDGANAEVDLFIAIS